MERSCLLVLPLLAAMVVDGLGAQSRRPCFGYAAGRDGEPLAGATVTCVCASPGDPRFVNDRQSAVTDARGRFRLPLWEGMAYTAWLVGEPDGDGRCEVSRLLQGATGGGYFEIEAAAVRGPRTLAIEGLAAWRERGADALRLHMSGADAAGQVVLLDLDSATAELPVLPATSVPAVLLDADDVPLVLGLVGDEDAASLVLPAPVEHVVTVGGAADLLATAEVQVLLRVPEPWDNGGLLVPPNRYLARPAVKLDAAHQCRVVLPAPVADPRYYWFRATAVIARARGAAPVGMTVASSDHEVSVDLDSSDSPESAALDLALTPAQPMSLAAPSRGHSVLVIPEVDRKGNYRRFAVPQVVTLDADGPTIATGANWRYVRVWQPAASTDDPALRLIASRSFADADAEPAPIAAATEDVRIQVVDVEKGPGREAWVNLRRVGAKHRVDGAQMWRRADSGGVVTAALPPGSYSVHATDGTGLSWGALDVAAEAKARASLTLELERLPRMRCIVMDKAGAPVAGARVHTLVHGNKPDGLDDFGQQHFDVAQALMFRLLARRGTGANGEIDLPIIPLVSAGSVFFFRLPNGGTTGKVPMKPNEEPIEVR